MDLGLRGRTAIIAGASAGIGAATARVLAAEGATLALLARPSPGLGALAGELPGAAAFPADLLDRDSTESAVGAALAAFGRLDIAVASVGAAQGGRFFDLPDATFTDAFELKVMGTVRFLRAVVPAMVAAGHGRVVVVVGNNGRQPGARMLPGSAANAALLAIVKGLADEVAGSGVVINAINPGPTRTARWDRLVNGLAAGSGRSREAVEAEQFAALPLGRPNEPEEIARLIAVMVSELAAVVTGTSLTVDGGATRAIA